jgi:hypothetical protein
MPFPADFCEKEKSVNILKWGQPASAKDLTILHDPLSRLE